MNSTMKLKHYWKIGNNIMKKIVSVILLFSLLMSQDDSKIYWNSLATDVTVGVPLADDESLIGGRIQILSLIHI